MANEGFATYAEWLWDDYQSDGKAFDVFWDVLWMGNLGPPGKPKSEAPFEAAVYIRGAMTLHALRGGIGDETFSLPFASTCLVMREATHKLPIS